MAYIGKTPTIGNFQVCDAISVVNGQAAYTMQVGSVNVSPESANHMLVSLNGILQAPTSSFTVSGSTITFASNLVTGDVIDFIQILGNVLDLGVPSDSTVSLAKLTATGTKDATTFLRGDNTFNTPPLGGITEADQWRLTTSFTNTASPIASNLERNDNNFSYIGTGMTESSGIFTFPSTGIYYITFHRMAEWNSNDRNNVNEIQLSIDSGSSFSNVATGYGSISVTTSNYTRAMESTSVIIDVTNVSTFRVRFNAVTTNGSTASTTVGSTSENLTHMTFIRLGDT